jgi:hypothetical protein
MATAVGSEEARLLQIVHFYEPNPGRVVYTADNRGVVARWQLRNDGRLGWIGWSVAAVLNISYLGPCDDAADYRMLPVIIRPNQCAGTVVQFQGGISQCIGNIVWRRTELRTYGTNNHLLWLCPLNDEPSARN